MLRGSGLSLDDNLRTALQDRKLDLVTVRAIIELNSRKELSSFEAYKELIEMNNVVKSNDADVKKIFKKERRINVEYNRKDLSKGAFWPWNKKTRDTINEYAESNKDIAEVIGTYDSRNPIQKMLDNIRIKRMPATKTTTSEEPKNQLLKNKLFQQKSKNDFYDNFKMSNTYMSISDKLKNAKTAEQVKQVLDDAKGLIGEGEGKISHAEYSGLIYNAKTYGLITGSTAIDLKNKDNYHDKTEDSNDSSR